MAKVSRKLLPEDFTIGSSEDGILPSSSIFGREISISSTSRVATTSRRFATSCSRHSTRRLVSRDLNQEHASTRSKRMSNPKPRSRPLKEALLCSLLWHGLAPIRYPGDDLESYDALINLGRLYEIFFIAHDVRGLAPGAYYYDTNRHEFELVRLGALRAETELSIIGQHHARTAACTFVVAADFRLTQWQYRHNRTLRAFYVDAGKIVQHLILIATAHRLSTAMSAAINDSKICELLKMDPENEQAFFTLSVG
jgi:SagB-type dehydrogenase family enzyme